MKTNRGFVGVYDTGTGDAGTIVFPDKHTFHPSKSTIIPESTQINLVYLNSYWTFTDITTYIQVVIKNKY